MRGKEEREEGRRDGEKVEEGIWSDGGKRKDGMEAGNKRDRGKDTMLL